MNQLDPKIIAAIIVGTISLVLFVIKDIFLAVYNEFREDSKSKKQTFQIYAHPLLNSLEALVRRIDEIMDLRGDYLLPDSPKNNFNNYKIISTNYRLYSFIAWLTALKLEFNQVSLNDSKKYKKIDQAIFDIECALADGQSIEMQVAKELSSLWEYDTSILNKKQTRILGIEIEKIINASAYPNETSWIKQQTTERKFEILLDLSQAIAKFLNAEPKSKKYIKAKIDQAIIEVSITQSLIYRDWQNAIGNFMLKENNGQLRRFDIMSFEEFELLFVKNENIWIQRGRKLFDNLDFTANSKYDARIKQVKKLFCSLIKFKASIKETNLAKGLIISKELGKQQIIVSKIEESNG